MPHYDGVLYHQKKAVSVNIKSFTLQILPIEYESAIKKNIHTNIPLLICQEMHDFFKSQLLRSWTP